MMTPEDETFACVDHVNWMQDYYRSKHSDHHLEKFIEVAKRVAKADAAAGRPSRFDIEDADIRAKRWRDCFPVLTKAMHEYLSALPPIDVEALVQQQFADRSYLDDLEQPQPTDQQSGVSE